MWLEKVSDLDDLAFSCWKNVRLINSKLISEHWRPGDALRGGPLSFRALCCSATTSTGMVPQNNHVSHGKYAFNFPQMNFYHPLGPLGMLFVYFNKSRKILCQSRQRSSPITPTSRPWYAWWPLEMVWCALTRSSTPRARLKGEEEKKLGR